ncbi:thioesterase [Thiocapsa imhoffii]|uniref:Thioesterase n=1 Tax=Thiocapsa imhoffii TaxID=382777 RepID=A0A9X1BAG4_9GAMM|nr:acyl-CoA thioesterase [Thiocapsa imhoffii]MBK1646100.1 thioesterase [Thiocapsa imhoffii]
MTDPSFTYDFEVRLHDTDAAGRLFFAHLFRHAHDAYEVFMDRLGLPLHTLIDAGEILLPLVHAQADYRHPLHHGEPVRVTLRIAELRTRSFAVAYRFENADGVLAATALTVHLQVGADGTPAPQLAHSLRAALTPWAVAEP